MKGFRDRLQGAIDSSQYSKDIWKLSIDAGLSKKTVWSIVNDKRLDISQTGPGFFGMARVAGLLGTSLDYLAGMAPPIPTISSASSKLLDHAGDSITGQYLLNGKTPTADGLIRVFAKSGGMFEAFRDHLDHCDQYKPTQPEDSTLKVLKVGAKSLSSITMNQPSREILQRALDTVPDQELKARWVADYSSTLTSGPRVSLESLDVQMPNQPIRVKMEFIRVLLPVKCSDGASLILNFSLLVI